ncbi:hypothetical protein D3C80_1079450 [compost metagenome]
MRIKRIGLEHHGDAPARRRDFIDELAINEHFAAGNFLQTGDHAQQRRFSAAGGADENDEFALFDLQIDAVQNLHLPV